MNEPIATPTIGDNRPPAGVENQAEVIRARIEADHKWIIDRQKQLLEALPRVPETIDKDNVGQATDFIKQLTQASKTLNGARTTEKEPYLAGGRTIDGLFKNLTEPLKKAKESVQARVAIYLRAKEAEERKKREEEAERQRQERERIEREAREAEERRQAEEEERRQETERKEQEHLAELVRKEEETKFEIAEEKRERIAKVQERFLGGRIDKERRDELIFEIGQRNERVTADSEAALERAFGRAERLSEREKERLAVEQRKAAREGKRDDRQLEQAKAQETKAEKKAEAPAADLVRERGEYGSVGTLRTDMAFRVTSWDDLDLEALRPFISQDALEQAIRAYIKTGKRELGGCEIYQDLVGQTR